MNFGTVKSYDKRKGVGFITDDNGGEELLVDHSQIVSINSSLAKGERVAYNADTDPQTGKRRAINVSSFIS